jgi:UDP-N-acetylglucosamine/UDP-N-acetylgalactosamine diphosphorylase
MEKLRETLEGLNQSHLLDIIEDSSETHPVIAQLNKLNIEETLKNYKVAQDTIASPIPENEIKPVKPLIWKDVSSNEKETIRTIGLDAICSGSVGAIILSGGQGTRLGFNGPKGMYNLDLPSQRSIFHIHIDRLNAVRKLAASTGNNTELPSIPVYIMTSEINSEIIKKYFKENNFFGYPGDDVFFFEQSLEPCVDFNGKIIMDTKTSLSLAPDGNGGIYKALRKSGAVDDMQRRGVKNLHVYGIDNILTKSADPAFLGACIRDKIEVGNKVCWRADKSEKVGVSVDHKGKMLILEYSEISRTLADATDDSGKLVYGAGNICNHYISVDFLTEKVFPSLNHIYHLAKKKIPYIDLNTKERITPNENNGYKLEMYIFDVFPFAEKWLIMDVMRDDEFAPVKNAPQDPVDSPKTARELLNAQFERWITAVGGTVQGEGVLEIAPSVSYEGEGLEKYEGKYIERPCYLSE